MQLEVRRKDRAASQEEAWRILADGVYGVLSTVSAGGQPYATPLNYCLLDRALYFHCALEGHKLANIAANPRVSFCVVGEVKVMPEEFSILYESAVVFGSASEVTGTEKQRALEALVGKYSADFRAEGLKYIEKLRDKARVIKISVEGVSAKARTA